MLIPLVNKKISLFIFFYLALSLIIVVIWTHKGEFLAHAENGLLLYNNSKNLYLSQSFWQENDLGKPSSLNFPGVTLAWYAAVLEANGFTPYAIQGTIFFILIATAFISMHLLVKELFGKNLTAFIAAIFYFGNLYTLTQIWMRFLYTQFFVWSYLPLFVFLWVKWIRYRNWKYLIFLCLTSFFFSYTFVAPTSLLVLWVTVAIFSLTEIIHERGKVGMIIYSSVLGLIVWILTNIWWIYPIWSLRNISYEGRFDSLANFKSLESVSQYFPVNQILLLRQTFWLGEKNHLYQMFSSTDTYVAGYIALFIAIFGLIILFIKKKYFICLLVVISLIVIKGTHPPFGNEIYMWIFENIPSLQILRNPYEKFGLVFVFTYAILFAIGLTYLSRIFGKYKNIILISLLAYCVIFLASPIWSGYLFSSNYFTSVPQSYLNVNAKISEISDGTILQLPLSRDAAATYNWNYSGEEPSTLLFNNASSSKTYNLGKGDGYYDFFPAYLEKPQFTNILRNSGISLVILHEDAQLDGAQESVDSTRRYINSWENINQITKVGQLELFSINNYHGRIYAANKLNKFDTKENMFQMMLNEKNDPKITNFYIKDNLSSSLSKYEYSTPNIQYIKISPDHYQVKVQDATKPFMLVLSQSYNPLWIAKEGNKIINTHIEVNSFANGWLVDKAGSYTIDIVFKVWPWD